MKTVPNKSDVELHVIALVERLSALEKSIKETGKNLTIKEVIALAPWIKCRLRSCLARLIDADSPLLKPVERPAMSKVDYQKAYWDNYLGWYVQPKVVFENSYYYPDGTRVPDEEVTARFQNEITLGQASD